MQTALITIFGVLVALTARAESDLGKKVESLNSTVQSTGKSIDGCTDCTRAAGVGESTTQLMKACVDSLCPSQVPGLQSELQKVYANAKKPSLVFNAEIAPLLRERLSLKVKMDGESSKLISEWLKKSPVVTKPEAILMINANRAMNDIEAFELKGIAGSSPIVDIEKTKARFPGMSQEELEIRAKRVNLWAEVFTRKAIPVEDPERIKIAYSRQQIDQFIQAGLIDIRFSLEQLESNPGFDFLTKLDAFKQMKDVKRFEDEFSGGRLDRSAISSFNSSRSSLEGFARLATDENFRSAFRSAPIRIRDLISEKSVSEHYRKSLSQNAERLNDLSSSPCMTAMNLAQQFLPTQSEVDRFATTAKQLRLAAVSDMKGLLSAHSSGLLNSKLGKLEVKFPITRERFLADLKATLQADIALAKQFPARRNEVMQSPDRDLLLAMSVSDLSSAVVTDEACFSAFPQPVPDAASINGDKFLVGPLALKPEMHAEGVCKHELGHIMDFAIQSGPMSDETKAWHAQTKECLATQHTEVDPSARSQFVTEDFADAVAARSDRANLICTFIRGLNDTSSALLSLKNSNEKDPHSSELFRLLHIESLRKNTIPDVCKRALASKGESFTFKNCLAK